MIITTGNSRKVLANLPENIKQEVNALINEYPDELLHLPHIIEFITKSNIAAAINEDSINCYMGDDEDSDVIENGVRHNLRGLMAASTLSRSRFLLGPLLSIGYVLNRLKSLKVLSIGPRTEAEFLNLVSIGFDPQNIKCIDLLSYSSIIELGDMHDLPYDDNSFDIIIMGWVIAYSKDPKKAAGEALRVGRDNCIYAVGCEYSPLTDEELKRRGSAITKEAGRYNSPDQILELFEPHVSNVYFRNDIHSDDLERANNVMAIFQK